jgi:peroxiredoxin
MDVPIGTKHRLKRSILVVALSLVGSFAASGNASAQQPADTAAHTRVGDRMPALSLQETSGKTFTLADDSGKVVVVSFWATWCPPCQEEMPRLEKEIWQKYKSSEFDMVGIAREETRKTVALFQKRHPAYTFPLAYDPQRTTYALFADSGIPRNYVVDRHGIIVYQSLGYLPEDIRALDRAIQQALAAK